MRIWVSMQDGTEHEAELSVFKHEYETLDEWMQLLFGCVVPTTDGQALNGRFIVRAWSTP